MTESPAPESPLRSLRPVARSFADFVDYEPSLAGALEKGRRFVADIVTGPYGRGRCLTLAGKSGTGKTMLCEIMLAQLRLGPWGYCEAISRRIQAGRLEGFTARLYDMRPISARFKAGKYGILEQMQENSLTVLDDVGADHDPSKATASAVDRILRARRGRWTLVTVNMSLTEIAAKLDSRIASFLVRDENQFVEILADDFALRKFVRKTV